MPDLADHAYAHASAILLPGDLAAEVAEQAVRRGGRSRSAVLGHARHCALGSGGHAPAVADVGVEGAAPADLTELAVALAGSRPPMERAIVDLDIRHGLNRRDLARALGLPEAEAAARAAAVCLEWKRLLDPVVLARLGPGGCEGLAAVLESHGISGGSAADAQREEPRPVSLAGLLAAGPAVADHAARCAGCGDRLRAMVSVRTLLAQRPLEAAPPAVRAAAARSKLLRFPNLPSPPPSLEPRPGTRKRITLVVAVMAAMAGVIAGGAALAMRAPTENVRVQALTRMPPPGARLHVHPAVVEGTLPPPVELRNDAAETIRWEAAPDVTWLSVSPPAGRLEPGQAAIIRLVITGAPEGRVRGAVRISSTDGSAAVLRVAATVEHPPEIDAALRGCEISATVEDEGEVGSVTLHWIGPVGGQEGLLPLVAAGAVFTGPVPDAPAGARWWVEAEDARGNRGSSPRSVLPTSTCR